MSALHRDQGELCCYCMCRIPPSNVEHLQPQTGSKRRGTGEEVAWENLLASCVATDPEGREIGVIPPRCNGRRGSRRLRVSPLQPDCEEFFVFSIDGKIEPTPAVARHDAAAETIEVLGLNDAFLTRWRREAIRGLELETLTAKDARRMRDAVAHRNSIGQLTEFAAAIESVLTQWIERATLPRRVTRRASRRGAPRAQR